MNIRKRVYDILDPTHTQGWLSRMCNYAIYALIFLSVLEIVLESVSSVCQRCPTLVRHFIPPIRSGP